MLKCLRILISSFVSQFLFDPTHVLRDLSKTKKIISEIKRNLGHFTNYETNVGF